MAATAVPAAAAASAAAALRFGHGWQHEEGGEQGCDREFQLAEHGAGSLKAPATPESAMKRNAPARLSDA
jgi:hypothetical protein